MVGLKIILGRGGTFTTFWATEINAGVFLPCKEFCAREIIMNEKGKLALLPYLNKPNCYPLLSI